MGGSTLQNGRGRQRMLINDWWRTPPAWTQGDRLAEHRERGWKIEERRAPGGVDLQEPRRAGTHTAKASPAACGRGLRDIADRTGVRAMSRNEPVTDCQDREEGDR